MHNQFVQVSRAAPTNPTYLSIVFALYTQQQQQEEQQEEQERQQIYLAFR